MAFTICTVNIRGPYTLSSLPRKKNPCSRVKKKQKKLMYMVLTHVSS